MMDPPKRWSIISLLFTPLLFLLFSLFILLPSPDEATLPDLSKRDTNARLRELLIAGQVVTGATNTSGQTSSSGADGDFTCGPGRPCGNGACCGASGWCGYEPKYCGKGCQSNCSAKAECGQYADPPGKGCPLNVCCSDFGFCGMTAEFCGSGCQSHCTQPKPKVAKSNAQQVVIGYYEGWSFNHSCGTMTPAEIPINKLTHLIFSFAYVSPAYKVVTMDGLSPNLFTQVAELKDRNPNLKVLVALGGWTYTDPGKYRTVFSDLVASAANRATFIRNLLGFLSEYGFDGVDFDWEYPGAKDRGGKSGDGANYAKLFKELRAAVNRDPHGYLVTVTAPTSYWYLRHFDLPATAPHVSWINLMSYDLHGVWDNDNPIGNRVLGHTNLTEIDLALDLFWRNDIEPRKVVLGLGFYGRSFKLKDPDCWKPGCRFGGPGEKGECTDTPGILSYHEVHNILARTKASPHYDAAAAVNYLVYGDGSWISFDDKRSFQKKVNYANSMGLSGLMVWAVDLDNTAHDALKAISPINADVADPLLFARDDGPSIAHGAQDLSRCKISNCGEVCDVGWTAVTRRNMGPDNKKRCSTKKASDAAYVCCPSFSSPRPETCQWHDQRSNAVHGDCNGECGVGQVKVTSDSFGWTGDSLDPDRGGGYGDRCGRGGKVFCCDAGNMKQYLDICRWTECGGSCKKGETEFTKDSGGPRDKNHFCGYDTDCTADPFGGCVYWVRQRRLCCPKSDSFKKCAWKSGKECSESCGDNQITLDTDPYGDGMSSCSWGREKVYCCDPPGGLDRPFTAVDLDRLFPKKYLPPASAIPDYTLTAFGGATANKVEEANVAGVAFFLVAGSSIAAASMKTKRAGGQMGLVFLDCPDNVLSRPNEQAQTARIICTEDDINACFGVREGGVEGTVVEMPEHCGGRSFSRAISLSFSMDQTIPDHIAKRNPTSAVFDFTFDYNMKLLRRDAGPLSIRIDYSNVPGYWDAIVDSTGYQSRKRGITGLEERFFSPRPIEWASRINKMAHKNSKRMTASLDYYYFDGTANECPSGPDTRTDEIAIGSEGSVKADTWYGFSAIATIESGKFSVHQASGFFLADGSTEVKFKAGGLGKLDTSAALQGRSMTHEFGAKSQGGHYLDLRKFKGWVEFDPYIDVGIKMTTANKTSPTGQAFSFEGYMEAGVKSRFYGGHATFPNPDHGDDVRRPDDATNKGVDHKNVLVPLGFAGTGKLAVTSIVEMGLSVTINMPVSNSDVMPEMSLHQELSAEFTVSEKAGKDEACLDTSIRNSQHAKLMNGGGISGWPTKMDKPLVEDLTEVGSRQCFKGVEPSMGELEEGDGPGRGMLKEEGAEQDGLDGSLSVGELSEPDGLSRALQIDSPPDLPGSDHGLATDAPPGPAGLNASPPLDAHAELDNFDGSESADSRSDPDRLLRNSATDSPPAPLNHLRRADGDELDYSQIVRDAMRDLNRGLTKPSMRCTVGSKCVQCVEEKNECCGCTDLWLLYGSGFNPDYDGDFMDGGVDIDADTVSLAKRSGSIEARGMDARAGIGKGGKVGTSRKPVTILNQSFRQTQAYPNFPSDPKVEFADEPGTRQLDAIPKWFVQRASCTNWGIMQYSKAQVAKKSDGMMVRVMHNTEHVFEGQTIGNFFNDYLQNGNLKMDPRTPKAGPGQQIQSNSWIRRNIMSSNLPGGGPFGNVRVGNRLADHLGGLAHLDRVVILVDRVNSVKGQLFRGVGISNEGEFGQMKTSEEQLLYVKEVGGVFTYMALDPVWRAFCGTYNGVYNDLRTFSTWYNAQPGNGNAQIALHTDWANYVRITLDAVVLNGRSKLQAFYAQRRVESLYMETRWFLAFSGNRLVGNWQNIKLDRTDICTNLPPSRAGPPVWGGT